MRKKNAKNKKPDGGASRKYNANGKLKSSANVKPKKQNGGVSRKHNANVKRNENTKQIYNLLLIGQLKIRFLQINCRAILRNCMNSRIWIYQDVN